MAGTQKPDGERKRTLRLDPPSRTENPEPPTLRLTALVCLDHDRPGARSAAADSVIVACSLLDGRPGVSCEVRMTRFRKILTLFDDYHDMMADRVRMEAYRKAIAKVIKPGDTVLDLGCGLGILSFLALQAGAQKVYAIEKSDSIQLAEEAAQLNGFADRIEFIKDNSLSVTLPEKVDVLVSETLGSFALEENTLEFTIDARKRFLKEGGRMIPEELNLWVAPAESKKIAKRIAFWKDVQGVDYSPAIREMAARFSAEDIPPGELLAEPTLYAAIDLRRVEQDSFAETIIYPITRNGTFNGLAGWFGVKLTDGIVFDTSPASPKTHWKQAFLPLQEPFAVHRRGMLKLDLAIAGKGTGGDDTRISYNFSYLPPSAETVQAPPVPGRNDPCPCGSGKKYKKCCGAS